MGLDISFYKRVKAIEPALFDASGCPVDPEGNEIADATRFYANPDFPGRFNGLKEGVAYQYDDSDGFRAGSYGGYNGWRDWLARVAGWDGGAKEAWQANSGPFWELINFSDCEGVIGPVVAAKLAKDFAEYDEAARKSDSPDGFNYSKYQKWRTAFEWAADGGAVDFH